MSAIPNEFVQKTARLSDEVTKPFPNSRKVYVEGSRPGHPRAYAGGQPDPHPDQPGDRGQPAGLHL